MMKTFFLLSLVCLTRFSFSQHLSIDKLLSDSSMIHASLSLCVKDSETGESILEYNPERSLIPASVMKLVTTAVAIELLGPEYTFRTVIGYTGSLNKRTGKLSGDIIIKGGGDPALGSKYFLDRYKDFTGRWVDEIRKSGIRKIAGRVIADDSYFDSQPVPAKWLWEDLGNYYGSGAYGLSVFDNTCEIHFKTLADSSGVILTGIYPKEYDYEFTNHLISAGTSDEGYVFAAPYSAKGWMAGTIPANTEDFVLKASISDPPLLIAKILNQRLESAGITTSGEPTTTRLELANFSEEFASICGTISPPLSEIIEALNHMSVNLFAEHLLKELGKNRKNNGSTSSGINVVMEFLQDANIKTDGMFLEDGSGLSTLNAINAGELVNLLIYMKNHGRYFPEYFTSLPEAGKEGTLKNYFKDTAFDSRLNAKSGSMTRVRSYAGYFTTASDRNMVFSIIINNYSGPSQKIISRIEDIIKEIILYE